MKKLISIVALLMFTSMSGLSFADKQEGVKIKFGGASEDKADKQQTAKKTLGSKKSSGRSGNKTNEIDAPAEHDH